MSSAQRAARIQILTGLGCIIILAILLVVGVHVAGYKDRPAAAQPAAPAPPPDQPAKREWRYIIVHHSAADHGNAAIIDEDHRKHWVNGLGYDFVIGNGHGSGDGEVEIGDRWTRQFDGAHTLTPSEQFNKYGIGICLIGDFEKKPPTPAQLESLKTLIQKYCREYHIPAANILGHREAVYREEGPRAPGVTKCPGKLLDMDAVRRMAPGL